MSNASTQLTEISQLIINPLSNRSDWFFAARDLADLVTDTASFQIDKQQDIGHGESQLNNGLAVSPTQAAMCAREFSRSGSFIRGLHAAIEQLLAKQTERPVRILYAGTGPYALLALPQIALFSAEQIQFTFIDIHKESLLSAKKIAQTFGYSDRIVAYHNVDACQYQIPQDELPDIIISETMNVTLRGEPQVAITRNLLSQAPNAIMVPQSVSVSATLLDSAKEHVLVPAEHEGDFPPLERDRQPLATLFELNATTVKQWEKITADQLPATPLPIPKTFNNRYALKLMTTIDVYPGIQLANYDCSLTMPTNMPGHWEPQRGETLSVTYQLGKFPGLKFTCTTTGKTLEN